MAQKQVGKIKREKDKLYFVDKKGRLMEADMNRKGRKPKKKAEPECKVKKSKMESMQKQYGKKKGKEVYYASEKKKSK